MVHELIHPNWYLIISCISWKFIEHIDYYDIILFRIDHEFQITCFGSFDLPLIFLGFANCGSV